MIVWKITIQMIENYKNNVQMYAYGACGQIKLVFANILVIKYKNNG